VVLGELTRQQLDVKVWLGRQKLEARVVGGRDREGKWRLYVTNLPSEVYSGEEVIELYRVRWQVELLFKQLKSQGGLDTLEGKTEATVKPQMYALLMGYVVCSALLGGASAGVDGARAGGAARDGRRACGAAP
jgi:transposase